MNIWVWAVNEENWPMVKENKIWAVDSERKAEKIKKGDKIVFYVTGTSYFRGIFQVSSDWTAPSLNWPDGRQTVLEVKLTEEVLGFAHLSKLKDLDFVKNHESIGMALKASSYGPSNSSKPIPENDYGKILSEIKRVKTEPSPDDEPLPEIDVTDFNDESLSTFSGSVRYHLVKSLFKDLLGPRMGPGEIIENPFDQYTMGILKSIYKSKETKEENETPVDPADKTVAGKENAGTGDLDFGGDEDEEKYLVDADLNPMQGARSLGLSFIVSGSDPQVSICCTWGRYENIAGLPSSVWKRIPNFFSESIRVSNGDQVLNTEDAKYSMKSISSLGVEIHFRSSRIQTEKNKWNVSIFLVNKTPFVERQKTEHYVFQPQIRILCGNETEIEFLGRTQVSVDNPENDDLLFWDRNSKGRGHLCGVVWKEIDPEWHVGHDGTSFSDFSCPDLSSSKINKSIAEKFKKSHIRTEYLPVYTILQPDLSDSALSFDASQLAKIWEPSMIEDTLGVIRDSYLQWIDARKKELQKSNLPDKLGIQASKNLDECANIANRISDGITLLQTDEKARLSFCFMNQVMSDKRRWDNRDKSKDEQDLKWYEFQMAFILQSLRGVIPGNDDDKKVCDILWFPTGGGKTESYLGLMVFVFAYRRLLDLKDFQLDGGVSIISRYTLRLLTIQQFTRALGALLAADMRRVQNWKPDSATFYDSFLKAKHDQGVLWGASRFSLGVWIGDLTPNRFEQQGTRFSDILNAHGALLPEYARRKAYQYRGEPAQVMGCPCCGTVLAVPSEKETKPEKSIKKLTWVIKTEKTIQELESIPDESFTGDQIVLQSNRGEPTKSFFELNTDENDQTKYIGFTVNFRSTSDRSLTDDRIDRWWNNHVKNALGYHDNDDPLQCTRASRPGYFFLYKDGENKPFDFAIHCPNKDCEVNQNDWFEDVATKSIPPVGRPFKKIGKPNNSIFPPIPAFTVDEQVYSRCPTVVIATADKFARLPFEPSASSLFGNIDFHDKWRGYGRGDPRADQDRTAVKRFMPPSLIIQDELHLIEGPLGSMVGLYEMAVDILSSNRQYTPKYIASTATIKEAESQVGTIYRRGIRIFPPPGISYGDNYFTNIKEDPSCLLEKHGRLYIGVLAPKGTLIVPVKIWASILSSIKRIRNNPELFGLDKKHEASGFQGTLKEFVDMETDWYWTLVGYFNALRELSIARSLYNADILRDVKKWSSTIFSSISHRLDDVRTKSAIRFVPIEIKTNSTISAVSVFCKNREGKLSVALYENDKARNAPGTIIDRMRTEDRVKDSRDDENEFLLEHPHEVNTNDIVWVAVFNYSNNTRFHSGRGKIKSRITNDVTLQNNLVEFPHVPQNSREINTTIRAVLKTDSRELEPTNAVELSSSSESQELPEIMERLHEVPNSVDCLFTTSMFGTGIDIDRLGLMIVMGQPKSTSGYIQSTGRVGRRCPGLVATWLRAARVRDLNHYENFIGYHRAIHRFVEPISAAPFSEETMNLCMGPVSVAVLRNAKSILGKPVKSNWVDSKTGPAFMIAHSGDEEILALKEALLKICSSDEIAMFRRPDPVDSKEIIDRTIAKWRNTAITLSRHDKSLVFEEYTMIKKAEENVVLGTPQHKIAGKSVVYRNARTSLRDVESTSTIGDSGWAGNS